MTHVKLGASAIALLILFGITAGISAQKPLDPAAAKQGNIAAEVKPMGSPEPTPRAALPVGAGILTFTFDGGLEDQATIAEPILKQNEFHATFYVVTSNDLGGANDDPNQKTMNSAELQALYDDKADLGCHTVTDTPLTAVSDEQLQEELKIPPLRLKRLIGLAKDADAYAAFSAFASPQGAYNDHVLSVVKQFYHSHVNSYDGVVGPDSEIYNPLSGVDPYLINRRVVTSQVVPEEVYDAIDRAAAEGKWLVLAFHAIVDKRSPTADQQAYQVSTQDFRSIVEHAAERIRQHGDLRVMSVTEALAVIPHKDLAKNDRAGAGN